MSRFTALTSLVCLLLLLQLPGPAQAWFQETETPAETAEAAALEAPAEEAEAEEPPPSLEEVSYALDNMMLMLSAVLVLFMQAGFAMVEVGFNSSKNAVNILFKNLMDLSIGALLFWVIGYNLMYPGDVGNGYISFAALGNFASESLDGTAGPGTLHPQVDFLFQVVFAATAATIVSGAVAGRMKFTAYLVYSAIITAFVYPISGMWKWGGGWLAGMEFYDFAGSILVHAVGGFAALAGAIVLGPRLGRFTADGKSVAMPGHNLTLATLGVFILLVGWYGFNPGSQLAFSGQANTDAVVLIATNTTLAACAGSCAAMLLSWVLFKKPDLSMALNGVLAGLVGITANCDAVTNVESMIIGAVAGLLVVAGIIALDKLKIDDPVGAFPVHGVCGVWGGLATGIFGGHPMVAQVTGSIVVPIYAFAVMFIVFSLLKVMGLLRVSAEEETIGLDICEHGMQAYGT